MIECECVSSDGGGGGGGGDGGGGGGGGEARYEPIVCVARCSTLLEPLESVVWPVVAELAAESIIGERARRALAAAAAAAAAAEVVAEVVRRSVVVHAYEGGSLLMPS